MTPERRAEIERAHPRHAPGAGECVLCELRIALVEAEQQVGRLQATLKAVCEDVFADECPKECKCDTYGHAEECGAVSAAVHAKNLQQRVEGLEEALTRFATLTGLPRGPCFCGGSWRPSMSTILSEQDGIHIAKCLAARSALSPRCGRDGVRHES